MPSANFPGAIVRQLRLARGITQSDFARQLAIKRPYLSAVESGKKEPSLTLLKSFAKELDIPVALLLAHEDGPESGIYKQALGLLREALEFHRACQNA